MRADALNNLGEVYFGLGDLSTDEERNIQALDICGEIGGHAKGYALHNLGMVYQRLGHLTRRSPATRKHSASTGQGEHADGRARPGPGRVCTPEPGRGRVCCKAVFCRHAGCIATPSMRGTTVPRSPVRYMSENIAYDLICIEFRLRPRLREMRY